MRYGPVTLTEDQIERKVEFATDCLDRHFMSGKLSQREYDQEISRLDKWAQQQYVLANGPFRHWRPCGASTKRCRFTCPLPRAQPRGIER